MAPHMWLHTGYWENESIESEREQLMSIARSRPVEAAHGGRAKLILMLEDGESRDSVMSQLGCDSRFISRWSNRFLQERLVGMYSRLREESRFSRRRIWRRGY